MSREQTSINAATASEPNFYQEQREKSDLIRWQQELDNSLLTLKHRLRSETLIDGKWVSNGNVSPLLTESGITMIEAELSPFLGEEAKNLINSNLSEDMILNTLRNTADTIVCILADNYDSHVIDATPSRMSHITRIVKNAMLPTPFRAVEGWTKKQDNMGIKRIETHIDNENKKSGWFGG